MSSSRLRYHYPRVDLAVRVTLARPRVGDPVAGERRPRLRRVDGLDALTAVAFT